MKRITVAIASPSDVQKERDAIPKIFTKWNDDNPELAFLHPKMWEFATPEQGSHPQKILNKKIIASSDLLIAVLHSRLGTPTKDASSGTVEEIREFSAMKGPRRIMVYFCKREIPVDVDIEQLSRLHAFKKEVRDQGLVVEYTTLPEFEGELYRHLDVKVHEFLNNELPLPDPPKTDEKKIITDLPADKRLHEFIDFGTTLNSISDGFNSRMEEFLQIDGCTNDKYYRLGAHVYTSAAKCLDGWIYSSPSIAKQDMRVLENLSTRLKHLATDIPEIGSDFREYWKEGAEIASSLVAQAAHMEKCKK